jgi:hypothetical protein
MGRSGAGDLTLVKILKSQGPSNIYYLLYQATMELCFLRTF